MKKNYFLFFCIILLSAGTLKAQSDKAQSDNRIITKKVNPAINWITKARCTCDADVGNCYNGKVVLTFGDNTGGDPNCKKCCENKYVGDVKNGSLTGNGAYYWDYNTNYKSSYVGEFVKGKLHGRGVKTDANGRICDGQWDMGQFTGKGKITYENKDVEEGVFKVGKIVNYGNYYVKHGRFNGTHYSGYMNDGCYNGIGVMEISVNELIDNFENYDKDAQKTNVGKIGVQNGDIYIGEWKNCDFDGYGILYNMTTGRYKFGIWDNGTVLYGFNNYDSVRNYLQIKFSKYEIKIQIPTKLDSLIKANTAKNDEKAAETVDKSVKKNTELDTTKYKIGTVIMVKKEEGIEQKIIKASFALKIRGDAKGNYKEGAYTVDDSCKNVKDMLDWIETCMQTDEIKRLLLESPKIVVNLIATADKIGINGKIDYKGITSRNCYYEALNNGPYSGKIFTLDSASGIKTNPELAFVRSLEAKKYLSERPGVRLSEKTFAKKTFYNYYSRAYTNKDGQNYRMVSVEILIYRPQPDMNIAGLTEINDVIAFPDSVPVVASDNKKMAFIISNYNYDSKDDLAFGENDLEITKMYFAKTLGVENNLKFSFTNLRTDELKNFFCNKLKSYNVDNKDLIFYIEGRGEMIKKGKLLMPVFMGIDAGCDESCESNGIFADSIYYCIKSIEPRVNSVTLLFNVSYPDDTNKISRVSDFQKQKSGSDKIVCVHAASGGISYPETDKHLSAFTYFMCKSLYDSKKDKTLSVGKWMEIIKDKVSSFVIQFHNKSQTPWFCPSDKQNFPGMDRIIVNYNR